VNAAQRRSGARMRGAVIAGVVCSALWVAGASGQALAQGATVGMVGGRSTETHTNMEMSSNGGMMAAMRAPVTGEPYVAEKVTRSVWTLGDGTKITHASSSKIARDAEGRVREGIENRDAGSIGGQQINRTMESITIGDPVERTMTIWTLGPGSARGKIAIRMHLPNIAGVGSGKGQVGGLTAMLVSPPPPPGFAGRSVSLGSVNPEAAAAIAKARAEKDEVQTEELGADAIDGVRVEGKRTTTTIATGKIGNDRPLVITHEEWYSPDLKVVVKSVDEDPRTGERTMVLEGLTVGDPDPALFKVPEGYQVRDMPDMLKAVGAASAPAPVAQ
jgi:hypothetical protein